MQPKIMIEIIVVVMAIYINVFLIQYLKEFMRIVMIESI